MKSLVHNILISIIVISVILNTGCSKATTAQGAIRIGVVKNVVVSLPLYEIQSEKKLEAQGYNVQWVYFDSPTSLAEAFLAGDVQVNSAIGISTMEDLVEKGVEPRVIYLNGFAASAKIYSKNLKSIEEIRGKRLGMPPASTETSQLAVILLKDQNHVQAGKDYKLLNMLPSAGVTLLEKGDIDALLTYGTESATLERLGYHEIVNLAESWKTYSGGDDLPTSITIVTKEFATTHQEFLKAFSTAYTQVVEELLENPEKVKQITVSKYQLDQKSVPYFNQLAVAQLKGAGCKPASLSQVKKLMVFFASQKKLTIPVDDYFWTEGGAN